MEGVLSLSDVNLDGLTVLYRVDVNSPIEPSSGELLDDGRLRAIIPTIEKLSKTKLVILGHQSRPGKSDFTDMSSHSKRLQSIIGREVKFVSDICGEFAIQSIENLLDGEILFLDNVRMNEEEYGKKYKSNEDTENTNIIDSLVEIADVYVTDAFAASHRRSPTLTGFASRIPNICGLLMEKEIDGLRIALHNPPQPYLSILGGAKADDSLRVAKNLIKKGFIDTVAFVGVAGNMMLWASGHDIGEVNKNFIRENLGDEFENTWNYASNLISEHSDLLFLPSDLAIEEEDKRIPISLDDLPTEFPIYDIGIQTLMDLRPIIKQASCILWNGPASYFELPKFAFGTIEILNMCSEADGITIIGGGHTSALVNQRGASKFMTHNSTGGGSTMSFLSGERMPVIEALKKSYSIFSERLDEIGINP